MGMKTAQEEIRYWRRHVEAFKASGLTRKAYSKQAHINVYKLDYWRKKITRIDKTPEVVPSSRWVPLTISDDPIEKDSHIDLWVGRVRVEVKQGFDSKLLTEILRAVGAGC